MSNSRFISYIKYLDKLYRRFQNKNLYITAISFLNEKIEGPITMINKSSFGHEFDLDDSEIT